MCVASEPSRTSSEAADVKIIYQISVIYWWALFRNGTPDFPSTKRFQHLPFGVSS
jgi:hypothetical protein